MNGILTSDLKSALQSLKKGVKTHSNTNDIVCEGWLNDNYFLLERVGTAALTEIRKCRKTDITPLYEKCIQVCENGILPSQEEIIQTFKNSKIAHARKLRLVLTASLIVFAGEGVSVNGKKGTEILSNSVKSLRRLEEFDFELITGNILLCEELLKRDPSGIYGLLDDSSKNEYRKAVMIKSQASKKSEIKTAGEALLNAQKSGRHIGEFLITQKKNHLSGIACIVFEYLMPLAVSVAAGIIFQSITAGLLLFLVMHPIFRNPIEGAFLSCVKPERFIRLKSDCDEVKSVPVLITVSVLMPPSDKIKFLEKHLEKLYLSNCNGNIRVCCLTDFKAADKPSKPEDKVALKAARDMIDRLNKSNGGGFLIAVRPRVYSKTQGEFTGWERKRGAITDLMKAIKGNEKGFIAIHGDKTDFNKTKYIFALDADTEPEFESVNELIAIAEHPLNRPLINKEKGRVTSGYGIFVPRAATKINPSSSRFADIMEGEAGFSSYESLSNEKYQDLFDEGIFCGKGLIDVESYYEIMQNNLPEETVLSHDIIESGFLRAGYVSDVHISESFPQTASSYFMRLQRWIRGDWQNIAFVFGKNPLNFLSRYKLSDNILRSIQVPVSLAVLLISMFIEVRGAYLIAIAALLSLCASDVFSGISAAVSGGLYEISRKFYSDAIPSVIQFFARAVFSVALSVKQSYVTVPAVIKALWRLLISKKKLLEWSTAADSEKNRSVAYMLVSCLPSVIVSVILFVFGASVHRLAALFILGDIPITLIFGVPKKKPRKKLNEKSREWLMDSAAEMWGFFNEQCTDKHNFLPPDNIQFSPSRSVASRTSPTNIGLMLLSFLAARDLGFISSHELYNKLDASLKTVEKLEKYEGNLFNWYNTETCEIIGESFVSTVDSGNFVCSLVALKQGVREYMNECELLEDIDVRAEKLISETNLNVFYNKNRRLFHIGLFSESGKLSESFYDLHMSEMRTTAYYAVAKRIVPKNHWSAPSRTVIRNGRFSGLASWTGTMFEYFMPDIFLSSKKGCLDREALNFCIYNQIKQAGTRPFGVSESGFYAFDGELNYQYKAHGVQKLGLKKGLDKEYVVSPYSSFLTLGFIPKTSIANLKRLEKMGMRGKYGFYEAADFSSERCSGEKYRIVSSYMAHHVGMSLLSAVNSLKNNCMQRRFMSDKDMQGAESLLNEKIPLGAHVFKDEYGKKIPVIRERTQNKSEFHANPCVFSPKATLLSNGRLTTCFSDSGTSRMIFDGVNVTVAESDIASRPEGCFAVFANEDGIKSFVSALDKEGIGKYSAQFNKNCVIYEAKHGMLNLKTEIEIKQRENCEIRKYTIENTSKKDSVKGKLIVYFEPCLEKSREFSAHPTFSKLFLVDEWNRENECAVFSRNNSKKMNSCAVVAGFIDCSPHSIEFSREKVLQTPLGIYSLGYKTRFSGKRGNPDCCCAFLVEFEVKPGKSETFNLAVAVEETAESALNTFISIKSEKGRGKKANSPMGKDLLDIAVAKKILPRILYPKITADEIKNEKVLPQKKDNLWSLGISGDLPIILVKTETVEDAFASVPYIRASKNLRTCGIEADTVLAYDKKDGYFGEIRTALRKIISDENCELMLGVKGGIFMVNSSNLSSEKRKYLELCSSVIFEPEKRFTEEKNKHFKPMKIIERENGSISRNHPNAVKQYSFTDSKITIKKSPATVDIPWNLILANKSFGTMVSDKSLGFTWALNSGENKLTPWYNDVLTDNRGERLFLKYNGVLYDLISLSEAVFTPEKAKWHYDNFGVVFDIEIEVPERGMVKKCRVKIKNKSELPKDFDIAYFMLPVMGARRNGTNCFSVKKTAAGLVIGSSSGEIPGVSALQCDGKADYICFSSHNFFEGKLNSDDFSGEDFCAAVGRRVQIAVGGTISFSFYLSWGACENAATEMPTVSEFTNKNLLSVKIPEEICSPFIYNQVKNCRFYGRTAFYQCSGAYGFRDQLQDCLALVFNNPELVRTHIIRCASVQFEEGDVLHWWHVLVDKKQKIRGVRTRCSDDMLWLPFVCSDYVKKTGDRSILNVQVPYIEGEELKKGEKEICFSPRRSKIKASVYEHCLKAIEKSLNFGPHGLPLIGSCDWNDGFSNIGDEESGESVWLAMFQVRVLKDFMPICELMGDKILSQKFSELAENLETTVESVAWNGKCYARAITKDGKALGGEDFVDILPQAFAVFAEFKNKERIETALSTAYRTLVDEKKGIIKLFNNPFSVNEFENVGYIASYPEGIRENAGQYTHAAVWFASAMLKFGKTEEGEKLLRLINPMSFYESEEKAELYRAEPYVLAADISYGNGIEGRAGWTYFTGSAAWFYKCVIEDLLGYSKINGILKKCNEKTLCKDEPLNNTPKNDRKQYS